MKNIYKIFIALFLMLNAMSVMAKDTEINVSEAGISYYAVPKNQALGICFTKDADTNAPIVIDTTSNKCNIPNAALARHDKNDNCRVVLCKRGYKHNEDKTQCIENGKDTGETDENPTTTSKKTQANSKEINNDTKNTSEATTQSLSFSIDQNKPKLDTTTLLQYVNNTDYEPFDINKFFNSDPIAHRVRYINDTECDVQWKATQQDAASFNKLYKSRRGSKEGDQIPEDFYDPQDIATNCVGLKPGEWDIIYPWGKIHGISKCAERTYHCIDGRILNYANAKKAFKTSGNTCYCKITRLEPQETFKQYKRKYWHTILYEEYANCKETCARDCLNYASMGGRDLNYLIDIDGAFIYTFDIDGESYTFRSPLGSCDIANEYREPDSKDPNDKGSGAYQWYKGTLPGILLPGMADESE